MVHWLITDQHAPVSLRERMVFRKDVSVRDTRATEAGQLQLPRVRTEHARHFFYYRAASLWNTAPATVKETSTSTLCRKYARKWRLGQEYRYRRRVLCTVFSGSLVTVQLVF